MKSFITLFLLLVSLVSEAQDPLTIKDIMDIRILTYKKDFENITKILAYNNFEFTKKEENYDHGSYYVIADFQCQRHLPAIGNLSMGELGTHYPVEKVEIIFIDSGEFTELQILHSFVSDGNDFKNTFDFIKNLGWTYAEIGDANKGKEIASAKQAVNVNYNSTYDEEYGYAIGGWDEKSVTDGISTNSLVLKNTYTKFLLARVNNNNFLSNRTYYCEISPFLNKKDGYLLRNDIAYSYKFSIDENTPKFSEESKTSDLPLFFKIPLIKSGNIYFINVDIGDITKKYIFDSGASDVTLNQSTYNKLVNDGTIQFKHRLPKGSYKLADGTIVEYKRTLVPSITVGGKKVLNVSASIVPDDQPLLLGKSFLDKFKSWKIDNTKSILIIQVD